MKPKLPLTLVCVSCIEPEKTVAAIQHCNSLVEFEGGSFWFTDIVSTSDCAKVIPVSIRSLEEYSDFMIHQLPLYRRTFTTHHILVVQYDGVVVQPESWHPCILEHDYSGAPWGDFDVGGGGFSLRSQTLLECLHQLSYDIWTRRHLRHAEDYIICKEQRKRLELLGVKFATALEATRFSTEAFPDRDCAYQGSFGVHGKRTLQAARDAGKTIPDELLH